MIGNATRSPPVPVAAPAPAPMSGDKATQPDPAAHPFAEMLRQNRLAEAPAAAEPKAATSSAANNPPKTTRADDDRSPTTPAAPPPSRDAAQAKARTAAATQAPARSVAPRARATPTADKSHDGKTDDGASTAPSTDAGTTTTPSTASQPLAAPRSDTAPADGALGAALNAHGATGRPGDLAAPDDASAPGAADVATSTRTSTAAAGSESRRDTLSATADAASRTAEKTSESRLRDATAPSFAEALAETKTSHRGETSSSIAGHSQVANASTSGLAEPTRSAAPAADVAVTTSTLPVPVDSPEFATAFGLQVSTLARDGVQHAELHLNPTDMGPVSIQITLDGRQARVDFGADLAATRHAIEAGLPELASALRDAGFTLAGGGVAQHSRSSGGQGDEAGSGDAGTRRSTPAAVARLDAAAQRATRRAAAGGVDLYA